MKKENERLQSILSRKENEIEEMKNEIDDISRTKDQLSKKIMNLKNRRKIG